MENETAKITGTKVKGLSAEKITIGEANGVFNGTISTENLECDGKPVGMDELRSKALLEQLRKFNEMLDDQLEDTNYVKRRALSRYYSAADEANTIKRRKQELAEQVAELEYQLRTT